MSTYQPYDCQSITNREVLLAALAALGFGPDKVEVHRLEAQPLLDWHGHQTHYLSGNPARPDVAHVIIRRQHISPLANDIGFVQTDGHYTAIVSDFDSGKRFGPQHEMFVDAVNHQYTELQADNALNTVLQQIPQLKADGRLSLGATVVRRDVGRVSQLVVVH